MIHQPKNSYCFIAFCIYLQILNLIYFSNWIVSSINDLTEQKHKESAALCDRTCQHHDDYANMLMDECKFWPMMALVENLITKAITNHPEVTWMSAPSFRENVKGSPKSLRFIHHNGALHRDFHLHPVFVEVILCFSRFASVPDVDWFSFHSICNLLFYTQTV